MPLIVASDCNFARLAECFADVDAVCVQSKISCPPTAYANPAATYMRCLGTISGSPKSGSAP